MHLSIKNVEDIAPYEGEHAIEGIRFRPAAAAMGVQAWGMNVIELDPECEHYPEHDHRADGQEELYVVLRGTAVLRTPQGNQPVKQGDLILVGPQLQRKFVTEHEGISLLAIGATPGQAYQVSDRVGG